jgi:hypothetical protein
MSFPEIDLVQTAIINIGVWNYYEEITTDGFLFKNSEASIGAALLKPWNELYEYGLKAGINFFTLDQVVDIASLDAIIFMDHPRIDNPLVRRAFEIDVPKYLIIYECEVIKPDNWQSETHDRYTRIFTWNDKYVDFSKYIKNNFCVDRITFKSREENKADWKNRKLACLIAGAKMSNHSLELYSERIKIIKWFEHNHPDEFDLFGNGWDQLGFSSFRGKSSNKLETLSGYKFSFAFENAKGINGYITEKILDCLKAGIVPVYLGAPNVGTWIPANCFVDARNFGSYEEIFDFLVGMNQTEYDHYIDNIHDFIESENFAIFTSELFVRNLCDVISADNKYLSNKFENYYDSQNLNSFDKKTVQSDKNYSIITSGIETANELDQIEFYPKKIKTEIEKFPRKLILYITYGDELPIFTRARVLWEFYKSFYPKIEIFFVKESKELNPGDVLFDGHDLLVGVLTPELEDSIDGTGYASSGIWSKNENWRQISRNISIYDYFLKTQSQSFYIYQATITSVIDFKGLNFWLSKLPERNCFAGMPALITSPPEIGNLLFVCGTNSLFSSDLIKLMCARYDPKHIYCTYPNDVWQALILPDIKRIAIPFFTFSKARRSNDLSNNIRQITKMLLEQGHFHFRVKSTSEQAGFGKRENIDSWTILEIMREIIENTDPHDYENLYSSIQESLLPLDGKNLPNKANQLEFFRGRRIFPLNDEEAEIVFKLN